MKKLLTVLSSLLVASTSLSAYSQEFDYDGIHYTVENGYAVLKSKTEEITYQENGQTVKRKIVESCIKNFERDTLIIPSNVPYGGMKLGVRFERGAEIIGTDTTTFYTNQSDSVKYEIRYISGNNKFKVLINCANYTRNGYSDCLDVYFYPNLTVQPRRSNVYMLDCPNSVRYSLWGGLNSYNFLSNNEGSIEYVWPDIYGNNLQDEGRRPFMESPLIDNYTIGYNEAYFGFDPNGYEIDNIYECNVEYCEEAETGLRLWYEPFPHSPSWNAPRYFRFPSFDIGYTHPEFGGLGKPIEFSPYLSSSKIRETTDSSITWEIEVPREFALENQLDLDNLKKSGQNNFGSLWFYVHPGIGSGSANISVKKLTTDDELSSNFRYEVTASDCRPSNIVIELIAAVNNEEYFGDTSRGFNATYFTLVGRTNSSEDEIVETKVDDAELATFDIFTIDGICVRRKARSFSGLQPGLYIGGGRKVYIKSRFDNIY